MSLRRVIRRLRYEKASMLIELLIALTFLAVAVGALVSVYASSVITLRHASIEGNALTLADKQMETLKTLAYSAVAIDSSTLPSAGDPYVTSPPSNLTSSQQASITSGQIEHGAVSATQTVTGPDSRTYRVDTYIFETNDSASSFEKYLQATVAVRSVVGGTVGQIRSQATSALDDASTHVPPS